MLVERTWLYALAHHADLAVALRQHVALSAAAFVAAALVSLPLGVLAARSAAGRALVSIMTAVRVVPSLAVLAFMLPVLGLGFVPALVALFILACPPILINTDAGFRDLDPAVREAARGMGMRGWQLLTRVEAPLAAPVIIAGLRTAAVEVIASATLAAFIGAGGLGTFILDGLANNDARQLMLGAVSVAGLALGVEAAASIALTAAARPRAADATGLAVA